MTFDTPLSEQARDKALFYQEAFSRNIGLLTEQEQEILQSSRVAIPGMGGVGGVHLITLVRSGVGKFTLADFDVFEPANVNRQYGARTPDFGRPKLDVMAAEALSINPYLEIKQFPQGISIDNIDDFLEGVEVVLDGLDFFNFDVRRLLFKRAREKGIYVITAGPMGFSSALLIFSPDAGMGFDEYFHIHDDMSEQDKLLSFALGLAPRATHIKYMDLTKVDLDAKKGPSLNIACQLCSALAATETLRIFLKRGGIKPVPYYFQFDPYRQTYRKGYLFYGNRHPLQQFKRKYAKRKLQQGKAVAVGLPPELPKQAAASDSIPEEVIRYLIRAGIQAPSGDNAQPWKFSWQNNTISLYLDREADRSFFNIHQLASTISCGTVIENMRLAATAFGLDASITSLPSGEHSDLMAHVELGWTGKKKEPLCDAIWSRCTNRTPYADRPIPQSLLDDLLNQVSDIPGAKLHIITAAAQRKKIASLVYKADRIRTEHRPLHEHFGRMIRFTQQEALEKRDGFSLKNLEAGLAGEAFLKITRPWIIMNVVNNIGLGPLVALHSSQLIRQSSAVALMTIRGMEIKDFLKGGQAVERVWLTLTDHGLSMQPMTAVTLFWLRWQIEGEEGFLKKHRPLLRQVWEEYREGFPEVDFSTEGHVMLLRLGYGKPLKCGTYRKELDSFLLHHEFSH